MIVKTLGSEAKRLDDLVLDAALRLFDARGYEAVTDLDVALRAGLTLTEVHRRFASTQEMLGTIVDGATDRLFWHRVEDDAAGPREAFEALVREHLRLLTRNERLSRVVIREHQHLENPYRRSWAARTDAYRDRWLEPLRAAAPEWPPDRAEIVVLTALNVLNVAVTVWPERLLGVRNQRLTEFVMTMFPGPECWPCR